MDVDNLPSSVDVDNIETDNSTSEHSPGMDLSSESDNGSNKADDSSSVSDGAVGTVIKDVERTPGNLGCLFLITLLPLILDPLNFVRGCVYFKISNVILIL